MMDKRIMIVGKGGGCEQAPYSAGENEELWVVNHAMLDGREPTRLFYLHLPEDTAEWDDIRLEANEKEITIVTQGGLEGIDYQEKYPLAEIISRFGIDYFGNSIGYMIAYALYFGAKQIDLYGIPLNTQTEYIYEKANVEFWLGYAMGLGVKVVVHTGKKHAVLKTRDEKLYGFVKNTSQVVKDWKKRIKDKGIFEFIWDS